MVILPSLEKIMTLTRRDFSRLAAAAAAFSTMPKVFSQAAPAPAKKTRYAVVGLGLISVQHFMPACKRSSMAEVTGLVSGHPDKANRLAAEYNVPQGSIYTYENYDEMRNNPNIDAVYIGLPNGMHAEYTIRAAKAGKHVLCEKPMTTTVADAEAMIAACRKADRKLMIAYRCQLEATILKARELVRSGALGKIQGAQGAFGFNSAPGVWRLNRKLAGGGPLMDVGIYPLNTTRFLLGEEPTDIKANSSVIDHDGRFNEVEENLSWTMKFPSGVVASYNTTYGAQMPGFLRIFGSKGTITLEPAFNYEGTRMVAQINAATRGEKPTTLDEPSPDPDPIEFVHEADYFSRCVQNNLSVGPSGEEGLRDTKIMMEIYRVSGRT
jgi:predicted dehydrogenase